MSVIQIRFGDDGMYRLQPGEQPRAGDVVDTGIERFTVVAVDGPQLGTLGFYTYCVRLLPVGLLGEQIGGELLSSVGHELR